MATREHVIAEVRLSPPSGRCDGWRVVARAHDGDVCVRLDAMQGDAPLAYQLVADPTTLDALASVLAQAAAWLRSVRGRR